MNNEEYNNKSLPLNIDSNKSDKQGLNLDTNKKNIILSYNEINHNKENEDSNIFKIIKSNNIQYRNIISENNNIIKHDFLNDIKYGIDENGNPMSIKDYYKNIDNNKGNKKRRPIAYIIKDQNNSNILIDLNGNKIFQKNKEGDYEFPFHYKILIKDFDVKHPELRINGERLHSIEESPDSKNNNIIQEETEKNNVVYNNEKIIDEISFQIDSIETNDSTSQKNNNNNIKSFFKRNIWNKKKFMDLWKLRYGNNNSYNCRNNTIINTDREKEKRKLKKNLNRRFKNYSYNKVNTIKNQEIILRTNRILNSNNSIEDIYYKKNSENSKMNSIDKTNSNKSSTYYNKNTIKINRDYFALKNISLSPIKNININNSHTNKNSYNFNNNRVINTPIVTNLNSEKSLFNKIKSNNNSHEKYKNSIIKSYFNNSVNKRFNIFSTLITTPSEGINKSKKLFKDFNYNSNKCIFYSNNNTINNGSINRIRNNLLNKSIQINLNNKQNNVSVNEKNVNKNNCLLFNKCLCKCNFIKKKEKIINKKVIKKRNVMTPSNIRSIEYSENSIIDYNKNEKNKIENDKIKNKIKNLKICKLIKRIPINPRKKIQNNEKKCSILTKEASNMIKKYILSKNIIINQKNILKISLVKELNEKNRVFNKKNKSFNEAKENKKLFTEFN